MYIKDELDTSIQPVSDRVTVNHTGSNRSRGAALAAMVLVTVAVASAAGAQGLAPDTTLRGPLATSSAEYKLPAAVDPDILDAAPPRAVELWARVYRPTVLTGRPYPLVVILHGNHSTCGFGRNPRIDSNSEYTTSGTCPEGYVVVPNHAGYGYFADRLASWGYIVVSINANRGITAGAGVTGDNGLNLARGRLILRHLQRLSEWNTLGGTPASLGVELRGHLDFSSVGLLGHSRGGEGVRAAYNFYRDPDSPWPARIPDAVTFQGIFEIGAVDGQTSRTLNADGTTWNALLPMCDGDVSTLTGVRPFDRMLQIAEKNATQKSTFAVWGANHNFYNTEWQVSDSAGCVFHQALFPYTIGSPSQRMTAVAAVLGFFRGNVGRVPETTFNRVFNPLYELPPVITDLTRVDRGYTPSPGPALTKVIDDFNLETGLSSYGVPNEINIATITHGVVPQHDVTQRAGLIAWTAPDQQSYFQSNWTPAGKGGDIGSFKALSFRVSRQQNPLLNADPNIPTDFSIQLALADGTLSQPLQLATYADLRGPISGASATNFHPILQTVQIPLADFGDADLTQVRGVRVTFNLTPTGAIYVANIRLASILGWGADQSVAPTFFDAEDIVAYRSAISAVDGGAGAVATPQQDGAVVVHSRGNAIRRISPAAAAAVAVSAPNPQNVEFEIFSEDGFPVRDELVVLRIGAQEILLSRYATSDINTLIFTLTNEEFEQIKPGDLISVQYGRGTRAAARERWEFGTVNPGSLR